MQIDRSKAPINDSDIFLKIPNINLSYFNNIKIYYFEDHSQALINFKINFKNGAVSEKIPGTANFTMSMLQNGTKNLTTSQISEKFESLGASYFFNAYWDECATGFSCLEQYFNPCFELLNDCIFNSIFDVAEIERQRQKILAIIMQNNSNPNYLAQVAFNIGMFNGHNYAHPRIGDLESVSKITKNDLTEFYHKLLKSSEISIIITGNFNEKNIRKQIENSFEIISNNKSNEIIPNHNPTRHKNLIADKDDALQTNLIIGKAVDINRKSPIYPHFQVINTIFGGYFLSRLNHILREVKGLTYGIFSYLDSRKYGNAFCISTSINQDKTNASINDIFEISNEMANKKISEEEIKRSVAFMTGSFARTLETPKQITGLIQTIDTYDLELNFMTKFYKTLGNLTIDELFEVQKKYFQTDNYLIACAGNSKALEIDLAPFGDFTHIKL